MSVTINVVPFEILIDVGSKKVSPGKSKACKATEAKSASEKKLKGVTKRPKVDKIAGRFSVERFKSSDKDIEYYTGFCSYRSFEAFFRSLEAYIEKICITDVNYCVNNLVSNLHKITILWYYGI